MKVPLDDTVGLVRYVGALGENRGCQFGGLCECSESYHL